MLQQHNRDLLIIFNTFILSYLLRWTGRVYPYLCLHKFQILTRGIADVFYTLERSVEQTSTSVQNSCSVKKKMTCLALKQRLILNHNLLIQQLEDKYMEHILNLLNQKKRIIMKMQQELHLILQQIDIVNQTPVTNRICHQTVKDNDSDAISIESNIDNTLSSNNSAEMANADDKSLNLNSKSCKRPSIIDTDDKDNRDNGHYTEKKQKIICVKTVKKKMKTNGMKGPQKLQNSKMKMETKIRKYNCNVCDKIFKRKDHLRNHYRIHSNERPFSCDYCDKSFKTKHHLTRHTRSHTGERPYICDKCQRGFARNDYLNKHIKVCKA